MSYDEGIRATNDDASSCKAQAVRRGYWQDSYIQYFIRSGERKTPEINRGYYARVKGVQTLLEQFLELTEFKCQVINLGAGFDTTYWLLKDKGLVAHNYIEIDFESVTRRKCHYINTRKQLSCKLENTEQSPLTISDTSLHSSNYHIMGVDMRDLDALSEALTKCSVSRDLPTVFLAECVLVYMPSRSSSDLVKWIASSFQTAFFINYEMINMNDKFGSIMVENLISRGCSLEGISHCESLQSQKMRFLDNGWTGADAWDMVSVYKSLPRDELDSNVTTYSPAPLRRLQMDLFSHYCLTWAYVNDHHHHHPPPISSSVSTDAAHSGRMHALHEITIGALIH